MSDPRDKKVPLKQALTHMLRSPSLFGVKMQQTWTGLFTIEKLLNERPDIRAVVEIGSGFGAFSLYLAAYMLQRNGHFATVEITPGKIRTRHILNLMREKTLGAIRFLEGFDAHNDRSAICDLIQGTRIGNEPMMVICDGGDKKKELSIVAPFIRKGDILLGHDYGKEIDDSAIPKEFRKAVNWQKESEAFRSLWLILVRK